jgi:hypothetical protein
MQLHCSFLYATIYIVSNKSFTETTALATDTESVYMFTY